MLGHCAICERFEYNKIVSLREFHGLDKTLHKRKARIQKEIESLIASVRYSHPESIKQIASSLKEMLQPARRKFRSESYADEQHALQRHFMSFVEAHPGNVVRNWPSNFQLEVYHMIDKQMETKARPGLRSASNARLFAKSTIRQCVTLNRDQSHFPVLDFAEFYLFLKDAVQP
jgi:flagellar biosynthesis component FlhA